MTAPDRQHPADGTTSSARALLISVVLGAVGATVALAFVAVVAAGQSVLWPDPIDRPRSRHRFGSQSS